ncbi:hypothetical protein TSAR_008744 [Trichomalopsis sarcophagae]|uniref:Uncharacterized protein n=1 Tax=Trichomalopsis sarcophagae TaxID=543379 RepID=A0A232FFR5_9HYME|nr:hypothetical protein TSAR_008744 [Trichomalopsis sarcophagae]
MMQGKTRLGLSKAFMCCSNIIFLMSGFVLMSLGALLLADSDRVLLSRLLGSSDIHPEQPLFYYVSLLVVGIGFVIAITGILGCWASCLYNCCITVSYVSVIVLLLIGKCSLCVLVVFWPHLLGVDVRAPRLLRALQRSYALPGREQFTAAIDLAQTSFSCCGINSSSNYGTSWWRLQELGRRELVVPLSCCFLNNSFDPDGFLNPEPRNLTLCQSLNPVEHQHARHSSGCLEMIESWVQDQALIMLAIGLGVVLIELCALLSTLLACSRLKKQKHRKKKQAQTSTFTSTQTLSPFNENDHDYGKNGLRKHGAPTIDVNRQHAVEKSGLVNTKISVYEKNLGSPGDEYRPLRDSGRNKAVLGVPLVGMQHSTTSPVANGNSVVPILSSSRSKERDGTSSYKRRAPQALIKEPVHSLRKSTVPYPPKFAKNPYLTSRRFERDLFQAKAEAMHQTHPVFVSLRSSTGAGKRKTLYAKDTDGEEAVRVLTSLCLNPLARNSKRASFMMW